MSTPAKVYSSEAIEAVRTALISFAEQVSDALTDLSAEMRRMQEWLDHDRPRYWKARTRQGIDIVHEAQQALHRCLMFPVSNERPSCTEERAALKRAQAQLAYCQEKEDRVRHWQKTLKHELFEYEGRVSQLERLVEVDVPQAIGVLNRILRNLEEYRSIRARDPRAVYDDMTMARAIWDEGESEKDSDDSKDASAAAENGGAPNESEQRKSAFTVAKESEKS